MEMWQFSTNRGQRTALISCVDIFRASSLSGLFISIQVWGKCIVYLIRVRHNLHSINEIGSTLSLFYIPAVSGAER